MGLFGSRKDRPKIEKEGETIELFRLALLMSGQSSKESKAAEKKAFGKTLEDLQLLGHQCRLMAQAKDGSYWTVYGKAERELAKEMASYFPTDSERRVDEFLKNKGYEGLSAIKQTIDGALASHRIRACSGSPGHPYRFNKYGCCFGDVLERGKRNWLLDESLFGGKRSLDIQLATFWLALKELSVPDDLTEAFINDSRRKKTY